MEAPQVPQGHQLLEEPTPPPTQTVTRRSCRSWWGFSTIQRRPLPLGQQVPQVPLVEELKVPHVQQELDPRLRVPHVQQQNKNST